ncbi:putative methyltransferase 15 [Brachionus plicatilis]|uniref:Putative methyltransferase 15 n=1 Tax=Brachionus plicatilis TaxID=10195 RepID=A0A3M7QSV6_BRAPC|nr:putative methyltransferase 15 [Brachionus plicatilis]
MNSKIFKIRDTLRTKLTLCYLYGTQDKVLHIPVMLNEVLKHLVHEPKSFKTYLDLTFGAGGHTKAILESNPNSIVYASDRDPHAFKICQELSQKYPGRIVPIKGKFSQLTENLEALNIRPNSIDAALIDCGVSSIQFDSGYRGFSISQNGPLDMRMSTDNEEGSITASDVINKLDEEQLSRILWKYGEEKLHKKIAHGIVYFRSAHGGIKTTRQLADLIGKIVGERRTDSLNRTSHVATKTFQALRIFVNNELNELFNGINNVHKFLRPGGRLAVISFHSLEDKIIKSHFNDVNTKSNQEMDKNRKKAEKFKMNSLNFNSYQSCWTKDWQPINKKVIVPTNEEILNNQRSRSAKLRVAVKI